MNRRLVYALVASYVVAAAVGLVAALWAASSIRESEQQWCDVLTILDGAYTQRPPPSEAGQQLARAMHNLRVSFEC